MSHTTQASTTGFANVPVIPPTIAETAAAIESRIIESCDNLERLWDELVASDDYEVPPANFDFPADQLVSVVIPVYNERATIMEVIARVKALPVPMEIIVVDDFSTDGTRGWLETVRGAPGLEIVFKPRNEGKGAALRTGFETARGDIVVVQDADLEYDPRDIMQVIRPLAEGTADVVYGSRFLKNAEQDPSLLHRLVNRSLTECSNLFTGLRLTDMETCYKAFRGDIIRSIPLRQNRFGFEPEVTAKLARRRYRITEMPIGYEARGYQQGKKIGVFDLFNAIYCILRYGLAD